MIRIKKLLFIFGIGTFVLIVLPQMGYCAAAVSGDFVSQITTQFYNQASGWASKLQAYAVQLFMLFLILDVAMLGIKAALGTTPIHEAIKQFCMILLFAGFILAVINNYPEWAMNLINGLGAIGTELGGVDISESPFKVGLKIVSTITQKISVWEPVESVGLLITAVIIIICFALITAQMVFIKCETYIAMNAAIILLGFGGSQYTKEYALNVMRYALSVAFKLFVMQLVLSVGMSFIINFESSSTNFFELLTLIGAAIVLLSLVKSLPDVVAGIINGSHVSSGASLTGAATAVGAGLLGAGMGMMASSGRGIQNIKDAANIANFEGKSGMGKLGHMAGTMHSAGQAARQDANSSGSVGQRTRSHMQDRLEQSKINKK